MRFILCLLLLFSHYLSAYETILWQGKKAQIVPSSFLMTFNSSRIDSSTAQKKIKQLFANILPKRSYKTENLAITQLHQNIYSADYQGDLDEQYVIDQIKRDSEIEIIQPNFIYHKLDIVSEQDRYTPRWNYQALNILPAQNIMTEQGLWDTSIRVAVLDTGIYAKHPAFSNIVNPYNIYYVIFYTGSKVYTSTNEYEQPVMGMQLNYETMEYESYLVTGGYHDWQGHGTHCAGIIGGGVISNKDFSGIAPYYQIMPIKVLDDDGIGNSAIIIQGALEAVKYGADLLSMSLGGDAYDPVAKQVYDEITSQGIPIIAAAGNSYEQGNPANYPAAFDSTIAVAALGSDNRVAYYSQSHSWVDIAAPGGDGKRKNRSGKQKQVFSTWTADPRATFAPFSTPMEPGEDRKYYAGISGTSMATPHISGIVAMIRSIDYSLTPAQIKNLLQNTGSPITEGYHPQQIKQMPNLKIANAKQAIEALLENGPISGTPTNNWSTINFLVDSDFPQHQLSVGQAKLTINYDDYWLTLPSGSTQDISDLSPDEATYLLPESLPPGGKRATLRLYFSGSSYIPDKSIYLEQLTATPKLIYRNYGDVKYSIYIQADSQKQCYVVLILLD